MIDDSQINLPDVLAEVDAVFERYSGGHDFLSWRATFPRALRWIAAGMPPA